MINKSCVRTFTFYNDRSNNFRYDIISEDGKVQRFRTLGYFDEMNTELVSLKKNDGNMEDIWEVINEKNKCLISNKIESFTDKSFQNIFGCPFYEKNDQEFWDNKNYTYIFIILVQFFDKESNLEDQIDLYKINFIKNVENNFENYEEYFGSQANNLDKKYIMSDYITFDRYDYLLAVKSNSYLPFVPAMQQLYSIKGTIALNSFTVTALQNSKENLCNEIIPSICIKCKFDIDNIFLYNKKNKQQFNIFSYLEDFKKKLYSCLFGKNMKMDLKCYHISGEDDIRIIARKVETKNLVKLFETDTILNKKYLCCFSTAINVSFEQKFLGQQKIKNDKKNINKNKMKQELINVKNKIDLFDIYPAELIKTLHQINSGLSALIPDNDSFRSYGFLSLYNVFKELIIFLEENQNKMKKNLEMEFMRNVFLITKSMGAALLTTVRSDFRGFQIPTFNANLYYAPTKLLVFYRAYLYQVLTKLNSNSNEQFIINTGNKTWTGIEEVIYDKDYNHKIYICSLSEKNIYLLKNSMIELTHEIAHHGLRQIRIRKKRSEYILDSYIRAFFILLKVNLTNEFLYLMDDIKIEVTSDKNFKEKPNNEIEDEIKLKFEEEINEYSCFYTTPFDIINTPEFYKKIKNIIKMNYKDSKETDLHLEKTVTDVRKIILVSCSKIEEEIMPIIMNSFPEKNLIAKNNVNLYKIYEIVKKRRIKISNSISNTKNSLLYSRPDEIESIIFLLKSYFKETFADIVAIITLELPFNDYKKILLLNEKNSEDIDSIDTLDSNDSIAQFRIYIVYEAMQHFFCEKKDKLWIQSWFHIDFGYDKFKKLIQRDWCQKWKYDEIDYYCDNVRNLFFKDSEIFSNFVKYIEECIKLIYEMTRQVENNEFLPHEIFCNLTDKTKKLKDKILFIDKFLRKYEEQKSEEYFKSNE